MDMEQLYKPSGDSSSLRLERLLERTPPEIWRALVDPANASRTWFGSTLEVDLKPGGYLKWTGIWEGKAFEDRAMVLRCKAESLLEMLYFSGLSGKVESPETRMLLVIRLEPRGPSTRVVVEQGNFADEISRDHSLRGWNGILDSIAQEAPAGSGMS